MSTQCSVCDAFGGRCPAAHLPSLTGLTIDRKARTVLHSSGSEEGAAAAAPLDLKEPEGGTFGRRDYWNEEYRKASSRLGSESSDEENEKGDGSFSWYTGWSDLEPFFTELVPDRSSKVLIPGIGNDAAMVDMYDSGYKRMTAFDYAPEGVECARKMFGPDRLKATDGGSDDDAGDSFGASLLVADARSLPFEGSYFDAVLEKGTLDAVYLSGGKDKALAAHHLSMAVSEFARVVRPGGIVFSVTAACVDAVTVAFAAGEGTSWKQVRDGSFYMTEDGVASNSVDATILAWERLNDSVL